jgi:cyclopropane-fatty-acyl-phospholipid synthase
MQSNSLKKNMPNDFVSQDNLSDEFTYKSSSSLLNSSAKYPHPLFNAFSQCEYGELFITTPDGQGYNFKGKKEGPQAYLKLYTWGGLDALIASGEIGFAEGYIHKQWDTNDLPALLTYGLVNADSLERYFHGKPLYALWTWLRNLFRVNSLRGSKRNIVAHYDLGNDFYSLWLDKSMTYSGALFDKKNRSLEEAQQAKYHRILGKLDAAPGMHILEIGCGWGGFAEVAAKAGLRVTSITISEAQKTYAKERIRLSGLDHLATIELIDYRNIIGPFDHIVSIGMFEHVGEEYWPAYFKTIKSHLKPGGKAIVQTITIDDDIFERLRGKTGFIEHYIFPGGLLPSKSRFREAVNAVGLECNEMFGFGQDYAITVKHWLERFESQRMRIQALGYDESFMRMWRFYLASCIASFVSNRTDVMQAELRQSY